MAAIVFKQKGDYKNTVKFLEHTRNINYRKILEKYGEEGVKLLEEATPVDTGLTSKSWYYTVENGNQGLTLIFCNSNIQNGVPIALVLHYGHATRQGAWVEGVDYINPTLKPIFDEIANKIWREVKAG